MLKLHNALWPGIVGKGDGADEPAISLDRLVSLTKEAQINEIGFDGIDFNFMEPHLSIHTSEKELLTFADKISEMGLHIGSVGAPIWAPAGGGSAMGSASERKQFVEMVRKTCENAAVLNKHGVRQYGIIRIDSADSPENWATDKLGNTKKIADTFREAAKVAADYGEKLAAEGEICWAGMHSWKHMLQLLEEVGMPESLGFQADLAHTFLFLLGYNASEHALLKPDYTEEEFWEAYKKMTDSLAPWLMDFHVAQSNGTVFGSGSHDKTGRHCTADAPDGKLDVVRCATYWLLDENNKIRNNIQHICWDGCMFPNAVLESSQTWMDVLDLMIAVRDEISLQTIGKARGN